MIPAEAVEAAARAMNPAVWGPQVWTFQAHGETPTEARNRVQQEALQQARAALEAAAPYMLAEAWEQGRDAEFSTLRHEAPNRPQPVHAQQRGGEMNITEFLLARIAEDEQRAKAAAPWATGSRHEGQPIDWSIHFDRWSPSRVLAECAAKRAIIAMYEQGDEAKGWDPEAYIASTVFDVMRALAAVYKDHPDYRQEWAS